jgi:hypothetical protein
MLASVTALLILFMLPFALIGLLLFVKVIILPKRKPMDESNRIGHLRLVWFAINKPEDFVESHPWLKYDEGELIKKRSG